MAIRKSKLMLKVEQERGDILENLIPELVNRMGKTGAADELGVSKATLGYWVLKLQLNDYHLMTRPGDTVEIKRSV